MTAPGRRLVRSPLSKGSPDARYQRQKLRQRLEQQQQALARWQKRLKRAFSTVLRCQGNIAGIERHSSIWRTPHECQPRETSYRDRECLYES